MEGRWGIKAIQRFPGLENVLLLGNGGFSGGGKFFMCNDLQNRICAKPAGSARAWRGAARVEYLLLYDIMKVGQWLFSGGYSNS